MKDLPVEIARYIKNYVIEASMRKGTFNDWVIKFLKGHTRAIRRLYHVRDIDRDYRSNSELNQPNFSEV